MSCRTNTDCYDHGTCNQTCMCFTNYQGEKCDQCKSISYQMNKQGFCLLKCVSKCDLANFECITDLDVNMKLCNCKITNSNPDQLCTQCIKGYRETYYDNCQPIECVQVKELCGGVGTCQFKDEKFSCKCKEDFTGTFCETCKDVKVKTLENKCVPPQCLDENSKECSGNGKCNETNFECACDIGYIEDLCKNCDTGFVEINDYQGRSCQPEICYFEGQTVPCSSNGVCKTEAMESVCECINNTSGAQCQNCERNFEKLENGFCLATECVDSGLECSKSGYCSLRDNVYQCICYDNFDLTTKCSTCVSGYIKIQTACVANQCVVDDTECSQHGSCRIEDSKNKCFCQQGYKGDFCDECDVGLVKVEGGACSRPECIVNNTECSMNGHCYQSYSSEWLCRCNWYASGQMCEICDNFHISAANGYCIAENCYTDGSECSDHGFCDSLDETHFCICQDNFSVESRCASCESGFKLKDNNCVVGSKNKLSGGAIAGIVIAVLIVAVGVWVAVLFTMKAKQKLSRQLKNKSSNIGDVRERGNSI